jgi:predicted transcriptional regulator
MTSEDPTDEETNRSRTEGTDVAGGTDVGERLDAGRQRAVEGFDEGIVDVLSWVLETETRARIYVNLRQHPDSTSEEVAEGTGLYPSTVREALAELHGEGSVERRKRESAGAGNNPYEYRAISPSSLVRGAIEDVQASLNTVFQLDRYMDEEDTSDAEPVTITVEEADDPGPEESEDETSPGTGKD